MIDTKEYRDVETSDIPRAFLKTYDTSGITHLKFDEMIEALLGRIDPDLYRNYIITDEKIC